MYNIYIYICITSIYIYIYIYTYMDVGAPAQGRAASGRTWCSSGATGPAAARLLTA